MFPSHVLLFLPVALLSAGSHAWMTRTFSPRPPPPPPPVRRHRHRLPSDVGRTGDRPWSVPFMTKEDGESISDWNSSTTFGFIGCGTISAAIVTGLLTQQQVPILPPSSSSSSSIVITKRSESRSTQLQETFPEQIRICDDNQEIVEQSDVVFLCVLPQQVPSVLKDLRFDSQRHSLVSLVSTAKLDDLMKDSGLPKDRVHRMICLPAVATLEGTCLVTPKQDTMALNLAPLFHSLGGCVQCENEDLMMASMVPSGLMGPMYGILHNTQQWLIQQGVPPSDASLVVAYQFSSMMKDAIKDASNPDRFSDLIAEQTPGGLNEQALGNVGKYGVFDAYDKTMDAMLLRIQGKSDGFC